MLVVVACLLTAVLLTVARERMPGDVVPSRTAYVDVAIVVLVAVSTGLLIEGSPPASVLGGIGLVIAVLVSIDAVMKRR